MAQTIAGLFPDPDEAQRVVEALTRLGVPHSDIGLVGGNASGRYHHTPEAPSEGDERTNETPTGDRVLTGVGAGAVVGGATGFLLGAVGLSVPVVGPIIAAGVLGSLLAGAGAGAVAGGLIGALTHVGVPADDAAHFAEGVRHGGAVVTARVSDELAGKAQGVFALHNAVRDFSRDAAFPGTVDDIPASEQTVSEPVTVTPRPTRTQTDEDPLSEIAIGRESRP